MYATMPASIQQGASIAGPGWPDIGSYVEPVPQSTHTLSFCLSELSIGVGSEKANIGVYSGVTHGVGSARFLAVRFRQPPVSLPK